LNGALDGIAWHVRLTHEGNETCREIVFKPPAGAVATEAKSCDFLDASEDVTVVDVGESSFAPISYLYGQASTQVTRLDVSFSDSSVLGVRPESGVYFVAYPRTLRVSRIDFATRRGFHGTCVFHGLDTDC
jgi:hypothetical protein